MVLYAIVDDAQAGDIFYSGNQWSHLSRDSNYERTITTCQIGGQGTAGLTTFPPSFTFFFNGADVKFYGGPITNKTAFNYTIDSGFAFSASINSDTIGKSGANFWSLQGLTSNQHTLDVTLTAGEFSLDYITYTHSPVASLSGNLNVILDDADSSVQLLGNWTRSPPTIPNGVPYQGTVSGSSTVGDTMKVQFEGSSVSVYGLLQQKPGNLSATFSIDGGHSSTYSPFGVGQLNDSNNSSWSLSQLFYHQDLTPGTHSLLVTVTQVSGSQTLWIDSIVFETTSDTLISQPSGGDNQNSSKSGLSHPKIIGIALGASILFAIVIGVYRKLVRPTQVDTYVRNPRRTLTVITETYN